MLSRNLKSAELDPNTIENQLESDLARGRVSQVQPIKPFISSPLGLVPKTDKGWRRIHHLSHPPSASVNDHIPPAYGALNYESRSNLLDLVRKAGPRATLIKRDLKDAFRMIPVALSQRWLLGFEWNGTYYHENCLPFGLRTAPFLFNLFAEALHWLLLLLIPFLFIAHYLDDFIVIVPRGREHLIPRFSRVWDDLTNYLGLLRNPSKDGQGTTLECLGIEIDTIAMEARLPDRKKDKAITLIRRALGAEKGITLEECEKLTGFLNFCSEVVPLGRTFLRRLYNFQCQWTNSRAYRPLTCGARKDLEWWQALLPTAIGIHLLQDTSRKTFHLFTDASSHGLGAFWYAGDPAHGDWRTALPIPQIQAFALTLDRDQHINISEIESVQAALQAWAAHWAHGTLILHTDNNTALYGFKNATVRGQSMDALRTSLLCAAAHDVQLHAVRISSEENALADALSRSEQFTIANLCPNWQTPFPLSLPSILSEGFDL